MTARVPLLRFAVAAMLAMDMAGRACARDDGLDDLRAAAETARLDAQALREEAARQETQARRLRADLALVAADAKDAEVSLLEAERVLASALAAADAARARRENARSEAERALAALILMDRETPAPALLGRREAAAEAARTDLAVGAVLEHRRRALADYQAAVDTAVEAERAARKRRQTVEVLLVEKRQVSERLDALIARAETAMAEARVGAAAAEARARNAAQNAADLADLADRLLDLDRPGAGAPRLKTLARLERRLAAVRPHIKPGLETPRLDGLPERGRRLPPPVIGTVQTSGPDTENPTFSGDGIVFAAAPGAEVTAPAVGKIVFADRYLRYGMVLILDLGDGDQLILIGCERSYVPVGAVVRRGQPIGRLPSYGQTRLYLELRRRRRPIDPVPWFDVRTASASG